jgi:hypothetical protein
MAARDDHARSRVWAATGTTLDRRVACRLLPVAAMTKLPTLLATLAIALSACQDESVEADGDAARARVEIFDPAGAVQTATLHAPRLAQIEDATICALSDHLWEANRILPEIGDAITARHPSTTFVSHENFPDVYGADPEAVMSAVSDAGCQAVVVASAA